MNYQALRDEIQNDPAAMGYAPLVEAKDWDGVAALLNGKTQTVRDTIERDVLQNELFGIVVGGNPLWFILRAAAKDPDNPLYPLADPIVYTISSPECLLKAINLDNPGVVQMMDGLAQASLITAKQREHITSLGDYLVSRADIIGLNEFVGPGRIQAELS